jgi:two-component system OmpR family response regulator
VRVLVVEDEPKMANLIRRGLMADGFDADLARRGDVGLSMASSGQYDAIVLDVMLPGLNGFEVCAKLRAEDNWTPILMLTARDAVDDRVAGLDRGADDYLVKPFSFAELAARLRALVRRGTAQAPESLTIGQLQLDRAARRVSRGEQEIQLSAKEFLLLETLMQHAGRVLDRYQLLEQVWEYDFESRSNVVDVYIRYLREKVDRPFGVVSIETVRGAGYRLRADGGRPVAVA